MYESFVFKSLAQTSVRVVYQANAIIEEYREQGFILTLRQLYYQFVARDLIPNTQRSYKRLGSIINNARMAGMVDWEAIEDRTRNLETRTRWLRPESIIHAAYKSYHKDHWKGQDYRPEVWIEKEALSGVIENVCNRLDVPYFACRGYVSQSEQWRAGKRFREYLDKGQTPVILHLGDHDPSGMDMTRDNRDRVNLFSSKPLLDDEHYSEPDQVGQTEETARQYVASGVEVVVKRLALNWDQIEEFNPPPNPAKLSDSRYENYVSEFGPESYELDALEPAVIEQLIEESVESYRDEEIYARNVNEQNAEREKLRKVWRRWGDVTEFLEGGE